MKLDASDYTLLAWGTTVLAAWHMTSGHYSLAAGLTFLAFIAAQQANHLTKE